MEIVLYVLVCFVMSLCFASGVYGDKGMEIRSQLGLLTVTSVGGGLWDNFLPQR